MFLKQTLLLAATVATCTATNAQTTFCEGVNTILADAPQDFRNIKGRMMESNMNATMWASTIKLQGSIGYRLVQSMGLFYEAAIFQTSDKEKIQPYYEEYKQKLADCLGPKGYKMTLQENVTAGLGDFKKVVFMKDIGEPKEGTTIKDLPPHATMEVLYNKDKGGFTVVIFLFQH